MTDHHDEPTAVDPGKGPAGRVDAVTVLTCYVSLLVVIPSSLVVGSFGAAGAPAGLFAVILLCWYLAARQHPGLAMDRGRQPVRVVGIFFACSVLAAYVSANRAAIPVLQENGADRGLIMVAGWMGVLLLAADGIDRADRLRTLLRRVVMGATAMATVGMMEFVTGSNLTQYISIPGLTVQNQLTDLMSRDGLVRAMATTAEPLELAAVLAMTLPLALHQARFAPPGRRFRRWLQVVLIVGAMPMTGSRSSVLGLGTVAIVLLPTWARRERWHAYLILLAAPVLVWLTKPSVLSSFGKLFGQLGSDQSTRSRTGALSAAVPFVTHHPWFGQGFHTFFPQTYFFVDDQYVTSLIETGIIGACALVALFVTGWMTARRARAAAADAQARDLAQCLAASIAAAAACFATFDGLSFSIETGLFFLLLGCTGAAWRLARKQRRPRARRAAGRAGRRPSSQAPVSRARSELWERPARSR
jgi:polysaccharide biosynthesis protein PslJ